MQKLTRYSFILIAVVVLLTGCEDKKEQVLTRNTELVADAECTNGGQMFSIGLDANENDTLDDEEITDSLKFCHTDAAQVIFAIDDEAEGDNCEKGGKKITQGIDVNASSTLDSDEIQANFYACNAEKQIKNFIRVLPKPDDIAPAVSPVGEAFSSQASFLYTGSNPIQIGVDTGKMDEDRLSVVSGTVYGVDDQTLAGVKVAVYGYPEFGHTFTRENGEFDLAVNGGTDYRISYQKPSYLPAYRGVRTNAQQFFTAGNVYLLQLDSKATELSNNANALQTATSNEVSDSAGSRKVTLLVNANTGIEIKKQDGSTINPATVTFRATEYTVGKNWQDRMPAMMPGGMEYTYAVEMSLDEAIAQDAVSVNFNKPVTFYVDNFLDVPVGTVTPVGWYDRRLGAWRGSRNGVVVKFIGKQNTASGDIAQMHIYDGQTNATSQEDLDRLGFTQDELRYIAANYSVGKTLTRVQTDHFTAIDLNHYRPPAPPEPPEDPSEKPEEPETDESDEPEKPDCENGSVIECETQVLGETINITGTGQALHYRSDRVEGYKASRTVNVKLVGKVPEREEFVAAEAIVNIAGKTYTKRIEKAELTDSQEVQFVWDGKNRFGQYIKNAKATVQVNFIENPVYRIYIRKPAAGRYCIIDEGFTFSQNWAGSSWNSEALWRACASDMYRLVAIPNTDREVKKSISKYNMSLQYVPSLRDQKSQLGFAGWSLSSHHNFNPSESVIYKGDGSKQYIESFSRQRIGGAFPEVDEPFEVGELFSKYRIIIADFDKLDNGNLLLLLELPRQIVEIDTQGIIKALYPINSDSNEWKQIAVRYYQKYAYILETNKESESKFSRVIKRNLITGEENVYIQGHSANEALSARATPSNNTMLEEQPLSHSVMMHEATDIQFDSTGQLYWKEMLGESGSGTFKFKRLNNEGVVTEIASYDANIGYHYTSPLRRFVLTKKDNIISKVEEVYRSDINVTRWNTDGSSTIIVSDGDAYTNQYGDGVKAVAAQLEPLSLALDDNDKIYFTESRSLSTVTSDERIQTLFRDEPRRFSTFKYVTKMLIINGSIFYTSRSSDFNDNQSLTKLSLAGTKTPEGNYQVLGDNDEIYIFDQFGRHLKTTSALTNIDLQRFEYNEQGYLIAIYDRFNNKTTIERDAQGQLSAIVNKDGRRTAISLDAEGYLATVTDPVNNSYQVQHNSEGLLTSFTNPVGMQSTFTYSDTGKLISDSNTENFSWNLARSKVGNDHYQVEMTTAEGRKKIQDVNNTLDNQRITTRTNLDGTQTIITKNKSSLATTVANASGQVSDSIYVGDPRFGGLKPYRSEAKIKNGNLTQTIKLRKSVALNDPSDPFSLSELTTVTAINNKSYRSQFSVATLTNYTRTPESRTQQTQLNDKLQPIMVTSGSLAPITMEYDSQGRIIRQSQGEGADARTTTYSYYASGTQQGFLQSMTDPLDRTTSYEYDAAGRLIKTTLPGDRELNLNYNGNNQITSITPPGKTAHGISYNGMSNITQYLPPSVANVSPANTDYSYNRDQQLLQQKTPDEQVTFNYDQATNRLLNTTTPRGQYVYSYNPATGQVSSISSPDGITISNSYQAALLTGQSWSGEVSGTVNKQYNNDFNVRQQTVNNGINISFTYDRDQLLTQAGLLSLQRDSANGVITGTQLVNVRTTNQYNNFGELTNASHSYNYNNVYSTQYQHDKLGRITQKTETISGITSITDYRYNDAGFLVEESTTTGGNTQSTNYSYDQNGNRQQITSNNGANPNATNTITATVDVQDRLTSYGNNQYTYDNNGDLLSKTTPNGTIQYQYDAQWNLTQVTLPAIAPASSATTINYLIDGQNRRVGKKVNGTLQKAWLYQDQLNPVAELDGNNQLVSLFIYGDKANVPSYMYKNNELYRVLSDHLGSVRLVIHAQNGTIAQRIDYDAYGNITQDTNPGFQPFGFAGGLYDPDTKLSRFGYRDYDAETGRWTQKDPIRFDGGFNLYGYVGNDPVNWIDPLGLFQFGQRPLGEFGVAGPRTNGNKGLYHEHGFYQDGSGDNVGFFDSDGGGEVRKDSADITEYDLYPKVYDDNIMREAQKRVDSGVYDLFNNNCQGYSDKLRNEYDNIILERLLEYGPIKQPSVMEMFK